MVAVFLACVMGCKKPSVVEEADYTTFYNSNGFSNTATTIWVVYGVNFKGVTVYKDTIKTQQEYLPSQLKQARMNNNAVIKRHRTMSNTVKNFN